MGNDTARRSACPAPDRDCAEELAPAIVTRQAAPRPRYAAHAPPPLHAAMCGMPAGPGVSRLRVDTPASANSVPSGAAWSASPARSEEHTSELQSLMRIPYAVFCLQKNTGRTAKPYPTNQ